MDISQEDFINKVHRWHWSSWPPWYYRCPTQGWTSWRRSWILMYQSRSHPSSGALFLSRSFYNFLFISNSSPNQNFVNISRCCWWFSSLAGVILCKNYVFCFNSLLENTFSSPPSCICLISLNLLRPSQMVVAKGFNVERPVFSGLPTFHISQKPCSITHHLTL